MILTAQDQATSLRAKLFRGFADPSRLSIMEALLEGPKSVSQVVAATGLNQPNASTHLSCLHDCGLVARRPEGRHVYYALSDDRVARLLLMADELLADVARGVYQCTRYGLPSLEDS